METRGERSDDAPIRRALPACGATFEVSRPMARADEPMRCPNGHDDTVRLLPTVAVTGLDRGSAAAAGPAASVRRCGVMLRGLRLRLSTLGGAPGDRPLFRWTTRTLTAHLPLATRLLLVKADGSVLVHADGGSSKPL